MAMIPGGEHTAHLKQDNLIYCAFMIFFCIVQLCIKQFSDVSVFARLPHVHVLRGLEC